jgi:hypothetical protein
MVKFLMIRFVIAAFLSLLFLTSSCSLQKTAVPGSTRPSINAYQHFGNTCMPCHGIEEPQMGGAVFAPEFDISDACHEM